MGGVYSMAHRIWTPQGPHRIWTQVQFIWGSIFYITHIKWTPIDYGPGSIFYRGSIFYDMDPHII